MILLTVIVSVLVGAAAVAPQHRIRLHRIYHRALLLYSAQWLLLLLTFASCSLLRQDSAYNSCLCGCGHKLLLTAIALLVVATVTLIALETGNDNILRYILAFLLGALMSGTAFTVTGLLSCLVEAGCPPLRLRAEMTLCPTPGPMVQCKKRHGKTMPFLFPCFSETTTRGCAVESKKAFAVSFERGERWYSIPKDAACSGKNSVYGRRGK